MLSSKNIKELYKDMERFMNPDHGFGEEVWNTVTKGEDPDDEEEDLSFHQRRIKKILSLMNEVDGMISTSILEELTVNSIAMLQEEPFNMDEDLLWDRLSLANRMRMSKGRSIPIEYRNGYQIEYEEISIKTLQDIVDNMASDLTAPAWDNLQEKSILTDLNEKRGTGGVGEIVKWIKQEYISRICFWVREGHWLVADSESSELVEGEYNSITKVGNLRRILMEGPFFLECDHYKQQTTFEKDK